MRVNEVPKKKRVWCDGACFPNPGQGGWGWTDLNGLEGSGYKEKTTNNAMELTAVLEAMRALSTPGESLQIITDSEYVVRGATSWMHGWHAKGWKRKKNKPILNLELWQELYSLFMRNQRIEFQWIRGHDGDPGNEEADRLATVASGASLLLIHECSQLMAREY